MPVLRMPGARDTTRDLALGVMWSDPRFRPSLCFLCTPASVASYGSMHFPLPKLFGSREMSFSF